MSEKLDKAGLQHAWTRIKNYIDTYLGTKQNTLVSGTNIKTINNKTILGSGNVSIGDGPITITMTATDGTRKTIDVIKAEN